MFRGFGNASKINELQEKYNALQRQFDIIKSCEKSLDALSMLSQNGMEIIDLKKKNGQYYVVVTTAIDPNQYVKSIDEVEIYLFRLPHTNIRDQLARMYIDIRSSCNIKIVDWNSRYPDQGYGSILMEAVINHFRNTGYQTILGHITPVDYDHLDKLKHFYSKFGFKITDGKNQYDIDLSLRDYPRHPIYIDGNRICIREDSYHTILAQVENNQI